MQHVLRFSAESMVHGCSYLPLDTTAHGRYNEEALKLGPNLQELGFQDIVLCPSDGEAVRYANLPTPHPGCILDTGTGALRHVQRHHNASLFTMTNEPWYGLVSCRQIVAGEPLAVHYGPASGHLLLKVANKLSRA